MIRKLHHSAYRCRDSEETRRFYEDFLGLPLVNASEIRAGGSGRAVDVLHTFYRLDDGSHLAFFEAPDIPFDFVERQDFDLHIALEVGEEDLLRMLERGRIEGIDTRGIADHGPVDSIYFRDPNGYVVELCTKTRSHDVDMDPARNGARERLARWSVRRGVAVARRAPSIGTAGSARRGEAVAR